MKVQNNPIRRSVLLWQGLLVTAALMSSAGPCDAGSFTVTPLLTDSQDSNLVNPWGVSFTTDGSPFWVSDNGAGVATLYSVSPTTGVLTPVTAVGPVTIPPPGSGTPTGQVANTGAGNPNIFNGNNFLFVSEDGTVSGWRSALGVHGPAEVIVLGSDANVYKGATEFTTSTGNTYLFAANFRAGTIDAIKANSSEPNFPGTFIDPTIPAGFAPFNIRLLGGKFYVTYALQDALKHDDVAGPGNGFVDVFNTDGTLNARLASHGALNSPWGLAIAPASFGSLAGDLLVGNFGDGTINAFSLSGTFLGPLTDTSGSPIAIDGLWTLTPGSGVGNGGSDQTVYFTAGPNGETGGIFGAIAPVPEPRSALLGTTGAVIVFAWCRFRSRRAKGVWQRFATNWAIAFTSSSR
jgi:uncharacterized protein (TIGR03118 family)